MVGDSKAVNYGEIDREYRGLLQQIEAQQQSADGKGRTSTDVVVLRLAV